MRLDIVAIILATCALVISIYPLWYNNMVELRTREYGNPSIAVDEPYVSRFDGGFSRFENNGTATAYNIRLVGNLQVLGVLRYFDYWVGDLRKGQSATVVHIPLGWYDLEQTPGGWNVTSCILRVTVYWDSEPLDADNTYWSREFEFNVTRQS